MKNETCQLAEKDLETNQLFKAFGLGNVMEKQIPPLEWNIEDLLSPGVALISGPPTHPGGQAAGKSWLVLDICISIATGTPFWGNKVRQGKVLWLALEDNDRRVKNRTSVITAAEKYTTEQLNNIKILYDYHKRLDNGFIEELDTYIERNPDTRVVVTASAGVDRRVSVHTSCW